MIHLKFTAAILLACCIVSRAEAQSADADVAAARDFGQQGLNALEAGDFATAEDRFSRAIAMHDAPTLHLGRARARKESGRMIGAGEDYRAVLRWAASSHESPAFAAARRAAADELTALEPLIPRLTVVLKGSGIVHVGSLEWRAAAMGVATLIDPGEYEVVATDRQGASKTLTVRLQPGQHETANLDLTPSLSPAAVAARGASDPVDQRAKSRRTMAYVSIGVAAGLLVASVITGAIAHHKNNEFEKQNQPDTPDKEKQELRDSAVAMAWVSTGLAAAALVGGGVGTYLLLTVPSESRPSQANGAAAGLGAQLFLQGRF